MTEEQTHFGFENVSPGEKTERVRGVFDSVQGRYDLMNDLMSLGVHRCWKRFAIDTGGIRPGHRVLDVATGTGDLATALARRVGEKGRVVATDINLGMVGRARSRLLDRGLAGNLSYLQSDAESLPFKTGYFDRITMAFGLRNVTRKERALASLQRVLRPGGKVLILEFSTVALPVFKELYERYSFQWIPFLGERITGDGDSYRYLAESIRMHPDQESLKSLMEAAGFERCDYFNLTGGVVALHVGYKF